jgi:hypothetical protein
MAAIEMLMYSASSSASPLTLFVWGKNRIVPVRLAELQISEQMFDPSLNPIRVEIAVTLFVRTQSDFANWPAARRYWDDYLAHLEQLGESAPRGSLADLGLSEM